MKYIGEHLLPGQFGQFFLVLSLVASLVAMIAYFKSTNSRDLATAESWKKIGRFSFGIDIFSVFAIFGIIFFIISNHYFEYYYSWNHSDKSLEPKFLLSSIWEGQEGSFLLWAFWQAVLGLILMKTAKKWEAPVMTVMSFAQVTLATMLLGLYIFDLKIGNNPFMLTRHAFQDLPVFNRADYLSLPRFQDGNGLNQLLQNYWMVIHPPILFLGFASTIVPFAYAVAGLWKKDYSSWSKDLLPWSLFSAAILGLGIMMGAKWAYESLNFGGYWAWDPVENASLVPWLLLVAGIHTNIIFNSTGHSLRATYLFYILSFLLVLYSTYLTRSGDLQETSVHAFVNEGMNWQLRAFVFVFLVPSLILFAVRFKGIPNIQKEENTWSREFWMFIGSLVLFLSSLAIIVPTSFPIFNKVFGTNLAIGAEPEFAYNRIQVFVAIIIGILTAVTQYLKYKNTGKEQVRKKLLLPTVISLAISAAISIFGGITYDKFGIGFLIAIHVAIFASVYSVVANAGYIWSGLNGKLKAAGASVGHMGFALFLIGVLISSAKKEVLSINYLNPLNFGSDAKEKGVENLTLFQGVKTDMGKYWATYVRDTSAENGKYMYFHILMERKDNKDSFVLYPDLIRNTKGQEGFSNNPDSRHYLHKDIFSYISYADKMQEGEDTAQYKSINVNAKDTLFYSAGFMILDSVGLNLSNDRAQFTRNDTAVVARLTVVPFNSKKKIVAHPYLLIKNNEIIQVPDTIISQGLAVKLNRLSDGKRFEMGVKESNRLTPFVALKVLQFPMINLVWIGTVIMIFGFVMSMFRRIKLL